MTVVVNQYIPNKPYRPKKQEVTLVVKPGENITLTCEVLVDIVKYVHWVLPKSYSERNTQRTASNDLQKDEAFRGYLKEDTEPNKTRVEKFRLYNISEEVHAGTYVCQASYINGEKLYAVKEYHIQFKKGKI